MAPAAPAPEFALYVGPAGNVLGEGFVGLPGDVLGPGGELIPHQSVVSVSRGEADASAYWEPCDENGKRTLTVAGKPKRARKPKAAKTAPAEPAAAPPDEPPPVDPPPADDPGAVS
jgi:hypothetical protein